MTTENQSTRLRRIAVIGAGISGMSAAYLLAKARHRVTLFEAAHRLGGHARTVMAGEPGDQPVDTGFIVFNYENYPRMTRLFADLDVPVIKSEMSFSTSFDEGGFEYAFKEKNAARATFAQLRNALDPRFLRMLRDIFRFNARALSEANDSSITLAEFLDKLGVGAWFRNRYLSPLAGAIWSTPTNKMMDFPAQMLIRFFDNHGLLSHKGHYQWHTIDGGSIQYVNRLEAAMRARAVEIRLECPIEVVRRLHSGVAVRAKGAWRNFEDVVFATHSDDSLRLLSDASQHERRALGAVAYQSHRITLHSDAGLMPRRKICWSSWNYRGNTGARDDQLSLTYWMNCLQPSIPRNDPLFVTLNAPRQLREERIQDETTMRHPVYDLHAIQAQKILAAKNGAQNTWFCGAWMKNGFHEDGVASATDIVNAIANGSRRPAA